MSKEEFHKKNHQCTNINLSAREDWNQPTANHIPSSPINWNTLCFTNSSFGVMTGTLKTSHYIHWTVFLIEDVSMTCLHLFLRLLWFHLLLVPLFGCWWLKRTRVKQMNWDIFSTGVKYMLFLNLLTWVRLPDCGSQAYHLNSKTDAECLCSSKPVSHMQHFKNYIGTIRASTPW